MWAYNGSGRYPWFLSTYKASDGDNEIINNIFKLEVTTFLNASEIYFSYYLWSKWTMVCKFKRGQRDIWYWEVSYEWVDVVISLTECHDKVEVEKLSQLNLLWDDLRPTWLPGKGNN